MRLETNLGSVEVSSCGRGRNVTCRIGRLDPGRELRLPAKIASRTTGDVRLVATASYTGGTDVSPHDDVAVAHFQVAPCDLVGTWRNDRLTGTPARDWICGRRGDDRIDGGRGNDVIEAGSGRDTVLGGPGRDRVDAGGNADRVLTRDGERDIVDCGGERDTAIVDRRLDVVSRCEVVRG
jgi:Ca2+-binding RTX toxin-like protein